MNHWFIRSFSKALTEFLLWHNKCQPLSALQSAQSTVLPNRVSRDFGDHMSWISVPPPTSCRTWGKFFHLFELFPSREKRYGAHRRRKTQYPLEIIFLLLPASPISLFVPRQTAAPMVLSLVSTPKWFILSLKLIFKWSHLIYFACQSNH